MAKTKPKPARAPKPKPKPARAPKPTQALAIREPASGITPVDWRVLETMLAPRKADTLDVQALGDEATLGAFGLTEVQLTDKEEAVLGEPVDVSAIQIKPTGIPYLSHPYYTRLFNRAFGRLGWSLVQRSKPMRQGASVVVPYILTIHGQPAAFAYGEQEFFESNKDQTYGDAVESTVASALRRCAKRLGVSLELWDKDFLDTFVSQHCVRVTVEAKGGEKKKLWRLKRSAPFWNEVGTGQQRASAPAHQARPPQAATPPPPAKPVPVATVVGGTEPITAEQRRRLWNISRQVGRSDEEVTAWLAGPPYKVSGSKDIKQRDYAKVIAAIEAPGVLPAPGRMREPGED